MEQGAPPAQLSKQGSLVPTTSPGTKVSIRGRKGVGLIMGQTTAQSSANPSNNSGLQMLPSTPKVYKRTKRVLFARRMNFMDRPLLIITFQGVLGDFIKRPSCGLKEQTNLVTVSASQTKEKSKQAAAKLDEDLFFVRAGAL